MPEKLALSSDQLDTSKNSFRPQLESNRIKGLATAATTISEVFGGVQFAGSGSNLDPGT